MLGRNGGQVNEDRKPNDAGRKTQVVPSPRLTPRKSERRMSARSTGSYLT
jgi:hypothetical protein